VIGYRFHPFFNRQVAVLRRIRNGDQPAVIVLVEPLETDAEDEESQLRISVPCWMLDEAACASIVSRDVPRIDGDALVSLQGLLDQLGMPSGQPHAESGSMMAKGDRHETPETTGAHRSGARPKATDT
jgi:hypothetical protein